MNLTWYNGKKPSARLNAETVDLLEQAAQAWKRGDVSTAWGIVGWACDAPWVAEVLDSLGLSVTPDQQLIFSNAERSHAIREKIQEQLATTTPRNYSVKRSVTTLRSFLTNFSDNESLDWLKESANNLLTRTDDVQQPLRVALLGEFSSGKSRLVNAILGKNILSTGIVPVTRSVTRIVYSEEIHVTVCYADGTETNVALDELKPFTDERQNKEGVSDVVEVILGHPTPLLKKVELWDTPGFNSNNQLHDEVASQLLLEADAVLWIIAAHQVGSRTESKLLQTVQRAQGKVVAVLNQTDRLNGDDEIQNQIQEVKKHFSDFVEDVVATSAKWIEEGHPGGNLKPLMHVIESIGSWSQEQRSKKMTHRISAVANQALACRRIRDSENKTLRVLKKKIKADVKEQRFSAFALWTESQDHYTELIGVKWNQNNDLSNVDKTDPWFESPCLQRTPLALAYRALLRKELSFEGYQGLLNCLRTLEETHLHVCLTNPVAWKDDFLLSWRKGMDINVSAPSEYLFQQHQPVFGDAVAWLKKLCSISGTTCPTRWTGQAGKTRTTKNIINKLHQLPTEKEINNWFNTLDSTVLTIFHKSQPDWRIRL
ncbi:MAG: dynamin family protein, partial [Dehalococcoidia bacterium]|nr:dynamin family protein [Dehalococcoidia bacterium]